MTPRRLALSLVSAALMVVLAWALMTNLSRVLRTQAPVDEVTLPVAAPTPAEASAPRIRAKLFFASEDGLRLVPVEREVLLGEGIVGQARAVVEAQLAESAPEPLVAAVPPGTTLRGLYLSSTNEMFVDLGGTVQSEHPGGSMNEIFTVYTIVNAVTVNLPDVQQVQLLIEGHEVDTLAGHVDLRRPLRKNEGLIQQ